MIKIAITGDIGAGKSHIAKMFHFPVFDADLEVRKIYKDNKKCFKKLNKKLPKFILSFPIKKKEISKAILFNQNNLSKIIKIVHPIVRLKLNKFFFANKKKKAVVLDIPLLLENNLSKKSYILIHIDANKSEIINRLKKRKNFNIRIYKKLKKFQLPIEFKKKKSHFLIKNNFKNSSVRKNVKIIKNKILNNERNSLRY